MIQRGRYGQLCEPSMFLQARLRKILIILKRRFSPAVACIRWSLLSHDEFPNIPILGIIQLDLYPGSGVQDTSQSAYHLWNASLDHVSSIPVFTALYWAPLEDHPDTLIVLLQWEDPGCRKQFQQSVGFGLMGDLLTPDCFNRAAQLALPTMPQLADCNLELLSFEFKTKD